jgi:hypothetical protein
MHPRTPHAIANPSRPRRPAHPVRRPLRRLVGRSFCEGGSVGQGGSLRELCAASVPSVFVPRSVKPSIIPPVFKLLRTLSHYIEISPLCFQNLTKAFSRNCLPLITLQKPRGVGDTAITGSFVTSAVVAQPLLAVCSNSRRATATSLILSGAQYGCGLYLQSAVK